MKGYRPEDFDGEPLWTWRAVLAWAAISLLFVALVWGIVYAVVYMAGKNS